MSMRFISIEREGSAEGMCLSTMARPEPRAGEILIEVKAAGVNRPDVLQRMGLYKPPADASPILGLEAAGVVVGLGEGVSNWAIGDRVCGLANGGAYAEYVAIPEKQCLSIPQNISFTQAAALPETCFTVWTNLFDRAGLSEGESVLIHGGSSGIGTTAIQLAKLFGATVYTTAGSEEKCNACLQLGADLAINYKQLDFEEEIKRATKGRGVDVVLDMVGGDYISKNINVCALDARIVNIAFLQGSTTTINMMPVMIKRLTMSGSTLRPRSKEDKADIAESLKQSVWPLLEEGKFLPLIHSTFPLSEVAEAHKLMESSEHIGKIVLIVDETS